MRKLAVTAALAITMQLGVSGSASAPPNYIKMSKIRSTISYIKSMEVKYKLPMGLLLAIIDTESNFQAKAINPAGAAGVYITSYGLGQVTMSTAKYMCNIRDLKSLMQSRINIKCTASILQKQLARYQGEVRATIAAYQTGTACICKNEVFMEPSSGGSKVCKFRSRLITRKCSDPGVFMNQSYVNKVMDKRSKYRWASFKAAEDDDDTRAFTSL
jgi:soluble lytic murein transglycosylase-like protein